MDQKQQGFATRAIHAGQKPDAITGAVCVPLSLASTFAQKSPGEHTGYEYARTGNPTRHAFETNIACCENGKYGLAFASGSAATTTIINMLDSGDHVISVDDVYGGTQRYFNKVAARSNKIDFSFIDLNEEGALAAAITPKTKMVWLETPTNPTLKITDIKKVADICHSEGRNIMLVVDNTFMSPYFQKPLDLGADIVVHSVSKYINGHSDVIMGVVATNNEQYYTEMKFLQNSIGAIPAPFDCYMALRGMKTLAIRMEKHAENAMALAKYLEAHDLVTKVIYPGLPSHEQHDIAKAQMTGFGGMITFFLVGGIAESRVFLESLKVFILAESLGAVECLAEHPAIMTHASVSPENRAKLGISDSLIRLSVGIEDYEDIVEDVSNALDKVKASM